MDYDKLSKQYWQTQVRRTLENLAKIGERQQAVSLGREVPQDDALVLGTGRRLDMAIVFLDICDFSDRPSETLAEQELLLRVFNLFFTELIRIAEDYGGTVEKNTGDGLMAYFEEGGGDPPEDACKRAVAAALTMFYAKDKLINPLLSNSNIQPIVFRMGVDYGPVTVADVGAARRFRSLVAIGTTANVASKMLNRAGPNELVIGQSVCTKLPAQWQREFVEFSLARTGWVYRQTQLPYFFHKYTGRWSKLL